MPNQQNDNPFGELHPEVQERLERMESGIYDIKIALVGNEFGHKGLIPRLEKLESQTEQHDRKLLVWGSILSAAGLVLVYLKDYITSHKP